jgi:hypothetical protein
MGLIYGYARAPLKKRGPTIEQQRKMIEARLARSGWELGDEEFYSDEAVSHRLEFRDRVAGGALWDRLEQGDMLFVFDLGYAFKSVSDCVNSIVDFNTEGVVFAAIKLDMVFNTPEALRTARALMGLETLLKSEKGVVRAANSPIRTPTNGKPPYGRKWVRTEDGEDWKLVMDWNERKVMGWMVDWHQSGYDFESIIQHLRILNPKELRYAHKTRKPLAEWLPRHVERRIMAELKLRESEGVTTAPMERG